VLVHRSVTALAEKHGKTVWYDNYASNWSEQFMRRYLDDRERPQFIASTDPASLETIAQIYREHGAWTWFDDADWFNEEVFMRGPLRYGKGRAGDFPISVNMLRLPDRAPPRKRTKASAFRRFLRRFSGG
jgi:hypothetical protein